MNRRSEAPVEHTWLAPPGFTRGQLAAMFVALCLAVVLIPVGARAASLLNTVITDPGGVNKAKVDASGSLQVGGTVSVAGTPSVTVANSPTVSAQQNGPWSVGIAGTPTVSVTGTPSVSVAGTPGVNVANTPMVTSGDATTALAYGDVQITSVKTTLFSDLDVSANKDVRLSIVIHGFSASDLAFTVTTSSPDNTSFIVDGFTGDLFFSRLYEMPGQNLTVTVSTGNPQLNGSVSFLVTGRSN
jgi:hypothetical protein